MRSRIFFCAIGLSAVFCASCASKEVTMVPAQDMKPLETQTSESTTPWAQGSAPQPATRLALDSAQASSSKHEPKPKETPKAPAPEQAPQESQLAPPPEAPPHSPDTVTIHAPAPAPPPRRPAPAPVPGLPKLPEFHMPPPPPPPAPPRIPTKVPIPPEVQQGIDQIPKPPPLPRPEEIYIPLP